MDDQPTPGEKELSGILKVIGGIILTLIGLRGADDKYKDNLSSRLYKQLSSQNLVPALGEEGGLSFRSDSACPAHGPYEGLGVHFSAITTRGTEGDGDYHACADNKAEGGISLTKLPPRVETISPRPAHLLYAGPSTP